MCRCLCITQFLASISRPISTNFCSSSEFYLINFINYLFIIWWDSWAWTHLLLDVWDVTWTRTLEAEVGGSAKLYCSLGHSLPFVAASQSSPSCVAPNGHWLIMQQVNMKIIFPLHHYMPTFLAKLSRDGKQVFPLWKINTLQLSQCLRVDFASQMTSVLAKISWIAMYPGKKIHLPLNSALINTVICANNLIINWLKVR